MFFCLPKLVRSPRTVGELSHMIENRMLMFKMVTRVECFLCLPKLVRNPMTVGALSHMIENRPLMIKMVTKAYSSDEPVDHLLVCDKFLGKNY